MKALNYVEEMEIPAGTNAKFEGSILVISKGKAMIKREFHDPRLQLKVEGNKIVLEAPRVTRKEKMQIGTFIAHIKNMLKGVNEPYVYKLRICSGHFPMNIAVTGKAITVKNFVGEKIPRVLTFKEGVEVKIEGQDIIVSSPDKELAGMTAGAIELICRRPGFDPRIFQQGIYIIEKCGKIMGA
ncbi:50S ribosomal protein L6 [Candidatus Woesearchaeota archaeon]|nr:50S ribosomal protein L6 [Candidatus Woesearchaeota archaeon]